MSPRKANADRSQRNKAEADALAPQGQRARTLTEYRDAVQEQGPNASYYTAEDCRGCAHDRHLHTDEGCDALVDSFTTHCPCTGYQGDAPAMMRAALEAIEDDVAFLGASRPPQRDTLEKVRAALDAAGRRFYVPAGQDEASADRVQPTQLRAAIERRHLGYCPDCEHDAHFAGRCESDTVTDQGSASPCDCEVDCFAWRPWQLADDRHAYGDYAGHWILTTADGEEEHPDGVIYPSQIEADLAATAANKEPRATLAEALAALERIVALGEAVSDDLGGNTPQWTMADIARRALAGKKE